jgi:hypothetical protein
MASRDNQLAEDQAQLAAGRDLANWATAVRRLQVSEVPDGVDNLNVDGRRVVGVIQGFGQLWRKTYRVRLDGAAVTPAEVIAVWKQQFASFWPADSRFHSPQGGLAPGVVVLLDQLLPGHLRLSSGVMILYADAVSFTVMTAQGHPLAGWNTFSAFDDDGVTVAQGAGAHARRRPAVRAGHGGIRPPDGGPPVAADPPQPGRPFRCPRTSHVSEGAA